MKGTEQDCSQVSGGSVFSPHRLCFPLGTCSVTVLSCPTGPGANSGSQVPTRTFHLQSLSHSPPSGRPSQDKQHGLLGQEGLVENRKDTLPSRSEVARRPLGMWLDPLKGSLSARQAPRGPTISVPTSSLPRPLLLDLLCVSPTRNAQNRGGT